MNSIFELINPTNTVSVNRLLAHSLGLQEAVLYGSLVSKCYYYEQREKLVEGTWFYSTIPDLQKSTSLSDKQQKRCIDKLVEIGLIDCKIMGMPARRYFHVIDNVELLAAYIKQGKKTEDECGENRAVDSIAETEKPVSPNGGNLFSPNGETCYAEMEKHTYKSNIINPDKNQSIYPADAGDGIDKIGYSRKDYLDLIHENIDYDCLTDKSEKEKIDQLVEIMLDIICSTKDTVRVNGEDVPREVVKSRFLKLDSSHIDYVLTALNKNTTDVRNIRAYLITALYNAPATIDSYYTAWVNHDMRGE